MFDRSQIGSLLHEEHLHTIGTLQRLEDYLSRQTSKRPPDPSQTDVRTVLESLLGLAAEVERHFGFEENQLFPLLSKSGEVGMVALLTEEHAIIRPLSAGLADQAKEAIASGAFAADRWKDFHGRAMELCEREVFHIQKEEMGLLAAISMLVDPEDDARLAELYRT